MIRCALGQLVMEKAPDRERVRATSRDGPFAGQVLEEPDPDGYPSEQHLKVDKRIDAGAASTMRIVERAAERANLLGEAHRDERLIEPGVERIGGRRDDLLGRNPERLLRRLGLRIKHRQTGDRKTARRQQNNSANPRTWNISTAS
ncbi:MAG: hypothetical protein IIC18_09015 [Bacteroidetes bacterium]|nr:hypothetical protein [Bacteroidota bacterium]